MNEELCDKFSEGNFSIPEFNQKKGRKSHLQIMVVQMILITRKEDLNIRCFMKYCK